MKHTFRRVGRQIVADLTPAEHQLLRDLQQDLRSLVEGDLDPADPVVTRLFPPAVGDDVDDVTLGLLHASLLADRLTGLDAVVEVLDRAGTGRGRRVVLRGDEPQLVLGVLNDLRLALGARLGVATLDEQDIDPEDEDLGMGLAVMHHLGWWVEQMVAVLDPAAAEWAEGYDGPI